MYCTLKGMTISGVDAEVVDVEVDISNGLPMFDMVGLLASEVREAKERVRSAVRNSDFTLPARRITVNLSPADMHKSGTGLDLPIAIGILCSMEVIKPRALAGCCFIGELGLDGSVHGCRGILGMVCGAKAAGCSRCFVPKENEQEASYVSGIEVIGVDSLCQTASILNGNTYKKCEKKDCFQDAIAKQMYGEDFADVVGQESLKRAITIAVAGRHNLLMVGQPGSGKTMAAKRIPGILPRLTEEECLEVSRIYSVAGLLGNQPLIWKRPFRQVHHSVTRQGLIGGGRYPRPGEITLAHKGVLFLDEYAEFSRDVLEALRQPLEDRQVCIGRLQKTYVFPADFMLVAAMNPCRCGYYPDRNRCNCSEPEIERYLKRISGPLFDRIDLAAYVRHVDITMLEQRKTGLSSADMRTLVMEAWKRQKQRYANTPLLFNGQLSGSQVKTFCRISSEGEQLLGQAVQKLKVSTRGYFKMIKLARTIADLEGSNLIESSHIAEAVSYRASNLQQMLRA